MELRDDDMTPTEDLLARFSAKDTNVRRSLVERYRDRVYRIAFQILGDEPRAWDAAQEVFVKLLTCQGRFEQRQKFEAWLYRVTYNATMDLLRRPRRLRAMPEEEIVDLRMDAAEGGLARAEDKDAVRAVLVQIPAKYRAALVLREMEGLSPAEIARVQGIPQGLARWRVFKAREMFRRIWEKDYGRFDE